MSEFSPTRRGWLAASAVGAAAVGLSAFATSGVAQTILAGSDKSIRPFHVHVPEADLADLRRRLLATRWPDMETVSDQSQGVQLAILQPLVRYWATAMTGARPKRSSNALPQFVTQIDGSTPVRHIRSRHPQCHAADYDPWLARLRAGASQDRGPLTDPTAHGGRAEDAFHLVLPSYPGYGFSGKPKDGDWAPPHVAQAWHELMQRPGLYALCRTGRRLGRDHLGSHGDPGAAGTARRPHQHARTVPPDVVQLVRTRQPVPASFSDAEKAAYKSLDIFYNHGFGYAEMMNTRPQTLGYSLADSPVGMAAFFYEKFATWTYPGGRPEQSLTRDEMLDDITLYWLTNSGTSSSRSYWDAAQLGRRPFHGPGNPQDPSGRDGLPMARSTRRRASGPRLPITISSTSTKSPKAAISQPGKNRCCSATSCAPRSARCADNATLHIKENDHDRHQSPLHRSYPHHRRPRERQCPQLRRPARGQALDAGHGQARTNPEQLFAAGWSACFEGAMGIAARRMKVAMPADTEIDAEVDLCLNEGAYFLQARLNVSLPGLERDTAQALVDAAHQTCPYSKATRGNIDVVISLV